MAKKPEIEDELSWELPESVLRQQSIFSCGSKEGMYRCVQTN